MGCPIFLVDAFADKPFSGNPAAVCMLPQEKSAEWMQSVAAEMNQAETAFLSPRGENAWNLRWFTPTIEVNLCGHATLAAAHVLWQHLGAMEMVLEFHTRSGILKAERKDASICLDFPADPPAKQDPHPALIQLLGGQPHWFGSGRDDVIAVLDTAEQVRTLQPNSELIASFTNRGLIVTAPGDTADVDMVSRFFAPNAGIPEDSVTGAAHCLLAVYWGKRLGKTRLQALQASARTGRLMLDWQGDRVFLTGNARTTLTGEFHE
jgi:PhzF family phenazine biosynthesis protein